MCIDKSRLGSEKEIIEHQGDKSSIRIPIKFENRKGKDIKHYRIDKISIIDDKKTDNEITGFHTPEKSEKKVGQTEDEKKTTQVVNQENLWCQAIVTDKECIKKLKKQKKYRMDLALLPENGEEIKRKIIFDKQGTEKPKIPKPSEYWFLYLNLGLFIATLLVLSYWNLVINKDAYGQPFFFKDSWVSVGIGLLLGYFGISILRLIITLTRTPNDYPVFFKYPELFFEKDFIKKMKNKSHLTILLLAAVSTALLIYFFTPISLPPLPSKHFSYYDSENDREIEHPRIYQRNAPNLRMGINKKQRKNKEPLYVAGLRFDKKGDLITDYYEFIIEDSVRGRTVLNFEDVVDGKELEENQEHVSNYIYGKKLRDDNIKVTFEGGKKFTVTHVHNLTTPQLKKKLGKLYSQISPRNFKIHTFITDKDETISSFQKWFYKSIGTKTVRAEELLAISECYTMEMDTSFENDIKRIAMVWCLLNVSVEFNIKLNSGKIEKILKIFESYYKKNSIKGIDQRITQLYFRLLLYLEKNFAEDAYSKIHQSITRVLDNSGGEYYLYYLEECVRNSVLFEPYSGALEEDSLRIAYFKKKRETFGKLEKNITILKRINSIKETDGRSEAFIQSLIEELTPNLTFLPLPLRNRVWWDRAD
ncbi:MAG: hypothetical protein JSV88_12480 [Candidatus Aminicenantes bacterium]|nr:MAG: hypothetical protein JSV88_12480 [Candidatus Aminicenantes bacterium]